MMEEREGKGNRRKESKVVTDKLGLVGELETTGGRSVTKSGTAQIWIGLDSIEIIRGRSSAPSTLLFLFVPQGQG
jgi:hypothetical protein